MKSDAHDVDDEHARAVPGGEDVGAAARRAGRIVDRAQEPVVAVGEGERLALVPDVVAGGHAIGAGREQLLQDLFGDAEAAGGVLAVDDDEVEAMLCDQAGELRCDRGAAGTPDDVAEEEQPQATTSAAISSRSVAMSGRRRSCGSTGTRSTSWQAKAMPATRNVLAARDEGRRSRCRSGRRRSRCARRAGRTRQAARRRRSGSTIGWPACGWRVPNTPGSRHASPSKRRKCIRRFSTTGIATCPPAVEHIVDQAARIDLVAHRPEERDGLAGAKQRPQMRHRELGSRRAARPPSSPPAAPVRAREALPC